MNSDTPLCCIIVPLASLQMYIYKYKKKVSVSVKSIIFGIPEMNSDTSYIV